MSYHLLWKKQVRGCHVTYYFTATKLEKAGPLFAAYMDAVCNAGTADGLFCGIPLCSHD